MLLYIYIANVQHEMSISKFFTVIYQLPIENNAIFNTEKKTRPKIHAKEKCAESDDQL